MKATIEQLCELFEGIKQGRIGREAIQGLIDDSNSIGLKKLMQNLLVKARKAASEITDEYEKSLAFSGIAEAITKIL